MTKSSKMPVNGNVEPYQKREVKDDKKAMASTKKSVKTVAKDTNKTRRKEVKPTAYGTKSPKAGSPNPRGLKKADH